MSMGQNSNNNFMDVLNIFSFVIGLKNYEENIDQSQLQNIAQGIMSDIHRHLQEQDDKIDRILELLEGKGNSDGI